MRAGLPTIALLLLAAMPAPAQQAAPPPNYAQLRLDCADDGDVQRQIAGCNAVLAHPGETDNYAIAFNNRGHAEERRGNLPAALADYDRSLGRDPRYAIAHINRGRVLGLLGRFDEALAAIDSSLAIEANPWARLERARISLRQRDEARAAAELDQVIAGDATFADALIERARLRARQGDHGRALADFEAALAAESNNPAAKEGRDLARAMLAANPNPPASPSLAGSGAPAPQARKPDLSRFMAQPQRAGTEAAVPGQPPATRVETVRGLTRDEPFSLSYPPELKQESSGSSSLYLNHPDTHFQVMLNITPAEPGASAESAARAPAAQIGEEDRRVFLDFSLEQRSLLTLPAGPAHVYVASMTSPHGNKPRLRTVMAEVFSEGRHYQLFFMMPDEDFNARRGLIGFILANFSTSSATRPCCVEPMQLPW